METEILAKYNQKNQEFDKQRIGLKKRKNIISILRLLLFISFLGFFINYISTIPEYSFYSVIPFGIIFIFLVKNSLKLQDKIKHLVQLIEINKRELDAMNENFKNFDGGVEFTDHEHPFSSDIDVFGENSLFQIVNRTCTISGKAKLATRFKNLKTKKPEIREIQESVQELTTKLEWRQNFEATGRIVTESNEEKEKLLKWLNAEVFFYGRKYLKVIGTWLPVSTIISLVLSYFKIINPGIAIGLILCQLLLLMIHIGKINKKHAQVGKIFNVLSKYSRLLEYIEKEDFNSSYLEKQKQFLWSKGKMPSENVKELSRIIDNLDQRFNIIASVFLNSFFLWDINYMLKLEKWQETFKNELPQWINVISNYDSLISIAGFAYNNYDFVYPVINDTSFCIEAEELGHPLLKKKERITNDFKISDFSNIVILTGANMAGKSTFLRSIGSNLILAMIGAPVNASRFTFYPINLYTSLRTNDSLQKNESFFYAELKKLKLIIEKYERGEEIFILLDEILKGTNSKDQHLGSESLIKKLIRLNGVGIIATHDIELANLENLYPKQVKNLCFEIRTELDNLIFDYKIKPGYCKVMNASILMKQTGIID